MITMILFQLLYLIGAICFARFMVWVMSRLWTWQWQQWGDSDSIAVVVLSIFWPVSLPIILLFMVGFYIRQHWDGHFFPFAKWLRNDIKRRNER